MPDETSKPEPHGFGDLALQPTGSGVADQEIAYMEAALEGAAADPAVEVGGDADEAVSTIGGADEDESAAQPS